MRSFVCILSGVLAACSQEPSEPPDTPALSAGSPASPTPEATPAEWRDYINHRFDFAIDVPPGFIAEPPPANGDGRVFTRPDARLRVSGRYNLDDSFTDQIGAAREDLSLKREERTSPATWRGWGEDEDGRGVLLALARGEDRLVTVRFAYKAGDAVLAGQGARTLGSLRFVGHAGPVAYRYQPERFTLRDVSVSLPGAHDKPVEAQKLIAWSRARRLGDRACRYGLSGRSQPCEAEQEEGLAFAVLDRPIDVLRDAVPPALVEPSRLAGRSGFRAVETAEGAGASYAFIPAGVNTVAVVRRWRAGKADDGGDFQAVLSSLATARGARGTDAGNAISRRGTPNLAHGLSVAYDVWPAHGELLARGRR